MLKIPSREPVSHFAVSCILLLTAHFLSCPLLQLDANEIRQMLDSQDDGHFENER